MKNVIYRKLTFDGCIEIVKKFIGYSVYDCGEYAGWRPTLESAKRFGDYLSGEF